jgi:hypothetical protein
MRPGRVDAGATRAVASGNASWLGLCRGRTEPSIVPVGLIRRPFRVRYFSLTAKIVAFTTSGGVA